MPLARLLVRPAAPADAPRWLELFDEAVAWLCASGREGQWGRLPLSGRNGFGQRVQAWVAAGHGRVAEVDGVVVGAMTLGAAPSYVPVAAVPELYVEGLVVSRSHVGHHIGETLLTAALDEGRTRGLAQVRLDCWAGGDQRLVRYYERLGFRCTDTFMVGDWPGQVLARSL